MTTGACVPHQTPAASRTWEWYKPYFLRFKNAPRRILDLGCGAGLFLECCRAHGVEAVGLDLNPAALAQARDKGFEVHCHDVAAPFPFLADESFDGVFLFQLIEHLRRPAQLALLQEAWRVLKPGGILQVDSPSCYWREAQLQQDHIGLLSPRELAALAELAGFSAVDAGLNYRQQIPDLPDSLVQELWNKYRPDLFSQTAAILARK